MAHAISLREETTLSFRWEVEQFSRYMDIVVASQCFISMERNQWRGIWKRGLFLQLVSAVNPQVEKIR